MNKLTISLSAQELKIMAGILNYMLTAKDVKELRQDHALYLMLSCIHEFYAKLDKKNQEIEAFGYTPGKPIKVAVKRHEALAFYNLIHQGDDESDSVLPAIPSTTESLILGIIADIHKQFLA